MLAIGAVLIAVLAYQIVVRSSVHRLAAKVVPHGSDMGVVDYLESAVREGMTAEEVHRALRGYDNRRYYLAAIAGVNDSALIERYFFALPLRDLIFDVDYRFGRVFTASTESYGLRHARMISDEEARRRLGLMNGHDANNP